MYSWKTDHLATYTLDKNTASPNIADILSQYGTILLFTYYFLHIISTFVILGSLP